MKYVRSIYKRRDMNVNISSITFELIRARIGLTVMLACVPLILACNARAEVNDECGFDVCPGFTVEKMSKSETLVFIAGALHGVMFSDETLKQQGKKNFFCYEGVITLDDIVPALNNYISGSCSAEIVVGIMVAEISSRYPCELK